MYVSDQHSGRPECGERDCQTLLVDAKQFYNLHQAFNMFVLFYLIILLIRIQPKEITEMNFKMYI